jgi:iron complex outermembrane recepter protein
MFLRTLAQGQDDCVLSLSGKIIDTDKNPLPGATIQIGNTGTSSDKQGIFSFHTLCPGTYILLIKFIGFDDSSIEIDLRKNHNIVITLTPSLTELQTVEVVGIATSTGITNSLLSLSEADLDQLKGKSLGESLSTLPGVSTLQSGPAIFKPVIHGLHSQRILILNNGIRQEGQQWGIEHAPEIDPFIASEITVVKGAEAVRYGADAMGGVIIINTPKLHQTQKFGGELNAGFMSNNRMGVLSGVFEGGFKNSEHWSWRLQGTAKKGGDFSTPGYVLSNTGLEELNFSAMLGFQKDNKGLEIYASSFNTEIGILRAAHTGNLEDLESSIRVGAPWYIEPFTYNINNPKQKISHQLLKVRAFQNIKGLGKLNVLYGGQFNLRKEFDVRRGGRNERPAMFMKLFSNVLDVSLDHEHAKHSGSLGINATYKYNVNETEQTGIRPLIPDYRQFASGIFFIEKVKKGNWLLEAGARYDYQFLKVLAFNNTNELFKPTFNFHYLSGSAGVTYYLNQQIRINSHFAFSSRPPHASELYSEGLHHGTASIEEGLMFNNGEIFTDQAKVKKEVSAKWISTVQIGNKRISADFSLYTNSINNYIFLRPVGSRLTIRGYFPVWHYQQTDALLTGADALIKWSVTNKIQFTGKLSYIYACDKELKDVLIFIPPVNTESSIRYQTDIGKLEDFYVKLAVPIVFSQNRAPHTVYPSEIPDYSGDRVYDIAPAPAGYTLLNMEVGVQLPVRDHDLSISLGGENLTNRVYRNYMNRLRYFADDIGKNFVFKIKYNFHSHN